MAEKLWARWFGSGSRGSIASLNKCIGCLHSLRAMVVIQMPFRPHSGNYLERIHVVFASVVNSNVNFGRFEAEGATTGMEDEINGDEADIVDKVLMDNGAIIKPRLEALNVGSDVGPPWQPAFVDAFLIDLIAIIWSIRIPCLCCCPGSHGSVRPCLGTFC